MKICYHCMMRIENNTGDICTNCGKPLIQQPVEARYLKPGTELHDKYVVGYPIGNGGFGNTYIGWDKVLCRKVAIKEFYPEQYISRRNDGVTVSVSTETMQPRFRRGLQQFIEEARSVASLHDIKGVVEISKFFEENGTGYIIMEYLEGMDVKTILEKSGNKKDYEWCRRVVLTVLYTLREIHKRGVLHRDIAPDNIFVTYEGVIKLIDFGAAKHASALANMKAEVVLKVGYAPIEQYSKEAPQGPYTDLYAVAALFYRMLTGQKPIPANERINNENLVTPSEMGVILPEQAEMAIMMCLNVQPKFRLQSADEFMEALDGNNFVPIYEPEWILPPVEEKKRFSTLPIGTRIGIAFASTILIAGIVVGGIFAFGNDDRKSTLVVDGRETTLADLVGKDEEEAVSELTQIGIDDYSIVYEFSEKPEGAVISQSINAGTITVDDNTNILLTVSGGDEKYSLLDYSDKSVDDIVDYFSNHNFQILDTVYPGGESVVVDSDVQSTETAKNGVINILRQYSDDTAAGLCYSQSIEPGTVCNGSEEVTFAVSCGKVSDYEIVIPDFSGKGKSKVEEMMKEAGLADYLEIEYEEGIYSDQIKKGKVCDQSLSTDYVYNTLEKKAYKLVNGVRKNEQSDGKIIFWLSEGPAQEMTTESSEDEDYELQESIIYDTDL